MIKPVPQKNGMDCGVAALATLLALDYHEVYEVAILVSPRLSSRGMYQNALVETAARLGRRLARVGRAEKRDLWTETGIVAIDWDDDEKHYVVVHQGQVYDPACGKLFGLEEFWADRPVKQMHSMLSEVR